MEFLITLAFALLILVLIVCMCQVFTNAVEWVGHRFKLSDGVVGSVLAAVGTALPETIVPIVALASGALTGALSPKVAEEIGVGAILGAPFLLSTLGMLVIAASTFIYGLRGKRPLSLDFQPGYLPRDLKAFFLAYGLLVGASFISTMWIKQIIAGVLILIYAVYVYRLVKEDATDDDKKTHHDVETDLDPLYLQPKTLEPATAAIMGQLALSLLGIVVLAHLFVEQINHFSHIFKLSALLVSLIVTPIATEMPEKFNSFLWIGRHKDTLALGNMTGAMVFQSCIPGAIGLLFTPWVLSHTAALSVGLCLLAAANLFIFGERFGPKVTPYVCLISGLTYILFLTLVLTGVVSG